MTNQIFILDLIQIKLCLILQGHGIRTGKGATRGSYLTHRDQGVQC